MCIRDSKYIGLGTFVNGICIGYIVTAFYDPIHAHFGDAPSLAVQLAWGIAAVLVTALGAGWPCGPCLLYTSPNISWHTYEDGKYSSF